MAVLGCPWLSVAVHRCVLPVYLDKCGNVQPQIADLSISNLHRHRHCKVIGGVTVLQKVRALFLSLLLFIDVTIVIKLDLIRINCSRCWDAKQEARAYLGEKKKVFLRVKLLR
nr:unnamed protein product [Callosobruchus analis]